MKILYHHRTLGDGAEGIHISEMVNAFKELGHHVHLVGPAAGKKSQDIAQKNRLFSSIKKNIKGPLYELVELGYNIYGTMILRNAIRKFKPDFIYDRYITFNYSAVAIGKFFKVPVFLEVNAPLAYERDHESDEKLVFKKFAYWLEKKTCQDAFRTVVVSTPLKKYLISIGVQSEKILILPNGVNLKKFYPVGKSDTILKRLNIPADAFVIGFSGILRPWHGIDLLLKAFNEVHNKFSHAVLLLVGDGPIRDNIETLAKKLGCANALRITGRVPHEEMSSFVALFDVAVSPKATFYASPMKIPEYMAMQKVVVAPDTENIQDLIKNDENGLLFKNGEIGPLSKALFSLIGNEKLRNDMGKSALSEITIRLNWSNNAQHIINEHRLHCSKH